MLSQRSSRVLVITLCLVVTLGACRYTGYGDVGSQTATTKAVTWLKTQQQSDGGFEVAGFAGFETPDAVQAIANGAQISATWNPTLARNAVLATLKNGKNPLDALDNFADATGPNAIDAGQAAKLIVLVAQPLGLSPTAFDPQADGAKNLVATLDAGLLPNGSYGLFNATLYGAIAKAALNSAPSAATTAYIRNAQQANGGWSYTGSPSGADVDIDTTALAIQALVAARVAPTDPDLVQGLIFLAATHRADGAWQSFGSDDPNSTASAALAISAAGFDVNTVCWRNTVAPIISGVPYANPLAWLRSQQAANGHITSANDAFPPVNTFATSQTVEALGRYWLPIAPLSSRAC